MLPSTFFLPVFRLPDLDPLTYKLRICNRTYVIRIRVTKKYRIMRIQILYPRVNNLL